MTRPHVVVIGGGLAGLAAALTAPTRAPGSRWSSAAAASAASPGRSSATGSSVDNGQHVFLRCCDAYLGFLDRIGSAGDVALQDRLDITVSVRRAGPPRGGAPTGPAARGATGPARAPAHLAASLLRYRPCLRRRAAPPRAGRRCRCAAWTCDDPALDERDLRRLAGRPRPERPAPSPPCGT